MCQPEGYGHIRTMADWRAASEQIALDQLFEQVQAVFFQEHSEQFLAAQQQPDIQHPCVLCPHEECWHCGAECDLTPQPPPPCETWGDWD